MFANLCLEKATSKNMYKEFRSKVEIKPTAQLKYSEKYNNQLDGMRQIVFPSEWPLILHPRIPFCTLALRLLTIKT